MIKTKELFRIALFALALIVLSATGCSIIGFTIGAGYDKTKPANSKIPMDQIDMLKPGNDIEVTLKDSTQIIGKYIGTELISDDAYKAFYSRALLNNPFESRLPALGDSIIICYFVNAKMVSGYKADGVFCGFGIKRLYIEKKRSFGKSVVPFSVQSEVLFTDLQSVTNRCGDAIPGVELNRLANGNTFPVLDAVQIQMQNEVKIIPLNDIHRISKKNKKDSAVTGFFSGLCIDLFIALIVHNAINDLNNWSIDLSGISSTK